jgi:hypothetical protein
LVPGVTGLETFYEGGVQAMSDPRKPQKQLLHLVFGGELTSLDGNEFCD